MLKWAHPTLATVGAGVRPLHLEQALFDAILAGWVREQRARLLSEVTIGPRERLVRRLLVAALPKDRGR